MRSTTLLFLIALSITPPLLAQADPCPPPPSHISIESGSMSPQPGVTFQLRHFRGTLLPRGRRAPSCYLKTTVVERADIFISNESLTSVFAEKMGQTGSDIKDLKIKNGLTSVLMSGTIKKVVPLTFTIEGPVSTDGTSILMHADKIKADGIPVKALLAMLGEHLNSIFSTNGARGIQVTENTLSVSPEQVAHLKGNLVAVQTSPQGITLHYAPKPHLKIARRSSRDVPSKSSPGPV